MKFPFQIKKTYSTILSADEVLSFVKDKLKSQSKFLFVTSNDYGGSINGQTFRLNESRSHRMCPVISGTITNSDPTTIDIKISPNYLRILFFMIFPVVFIPGFILSDEITINGVLREPEWSERIESALICGVGPMIWCYFDSIMPIRMTETWIKSELDLVEKPVKRYRIDLNKSSTF